MALLAFNDYTAGQLIRSIPDFRAGRDWPFIGPIVFAAYLTGCDIGQRPVAKVAEDIRPATLKGWSFATSNGKIHIQSEHDVTCRFSKATYGEGLRTLRTCFFQITCGKN